MRVELTNIDDFCEELEQEAHRIHEQVVRVRIDRVPQQDEGVTYDVGFWATALVKTEDGDWVLEFGRLAGEDSGSTDEGSETAARWREQVELLAAKQGLTLRRGKIEIW